MSHGYRYWKPEGKRKWLLFQDSPEGFKEVIAKGAVYSTILSIDQDIPDGDSEFTNDKVVNYKGPLYFDIDSEDEEHSLLDCRRLLLSLHKDYGVVLDQIFIHCTGGKGFHIVVPAKIFSQGKALPFLPQIYKNMALAFDLTNLDYGIYSGGKGRAWRIENIKRPNERYKVRLTAAQVFSLTMKEITDITMRPGIVSVEPKNLTFSAELNALFKRSAYKPVKVTPIGDSKLKALQSDPRCITKILTTDGIKEGKRFNHVIMAIAAYGVGRGWLQDDIISRTTNLRKNLASSVYKTDRDKVGHIKSIYNYFNSCQGNAQYQFACSIAQSVVDVLNDGCVTCQLMAQVESEEYDPLLGLVVLNNCFYKRSDSGRQQLTTFNIKPVAAIEFIDSETSEYTLHTQLISTHGRVMSAVFMQPDWGSKNAFLKKLPHPDFAYLGGDTDVSRLFHVLGQIDVPKKIGVRTIGLHPVNGSWHFVCHDGSLGKDNSRDELLLESDYPLYTKILRVEPPTKQEITELSEYIFRFNNIAITIPLVGWFAASIFKERIFSFTRQFPLLFIFGAAGSGKTQTILTLKNLFALTTDNIKSIADVTNFTLIKSASSNNTIPLMLDEYKASTFGVHQVKMVSKLIRAAYNNEAGERGTAGQKIISYYYKSPIIIAGEQTVSEPAAKDRIIEVHLTRLASAPHLSGFKKLQNLPLDKLGKLLLDMALEIKQEELEKMYYECFEAVPEAYKDRPRVNQAVMMLGLRLLDKVFKNYGIENLVDNSLTQYWDITKDDILDDIKFSSKSDVDRILEAINIMAENAKTALYSGQDFIIENNVLKINMRVIYANFMRYATEYKLDADTPNYLSFLKLVKKEDYFLKDEQPTKLAGNVRLCMFLDVNKLKARGLSLSAIIDIPEVDDSGGELSI